MQNGQVLQFTKGSLQWNDTLRVDGSRLPQPLLVTAHLEDRDQKLRRREVSGLALFTPYAEKQVLIFELGARSWNSSSDNCQVGKWDNGNFGDLLGGLLGDAFFPERQMSCDIEAE
ncbi:uncharacterized protein PV07_12842 [Cladophialophora immunda]|uniref:Uncharacterized protein n=1 Tax=Cladophialophora immunda TaxID=569365 RepID=A0A0D1Z220_9EURO|nr:uncharacterized protein PV07_12842 [Cladophialophora immunda]KIW21726.1 hypothetical protein PV07_12842 [Cladophialophora immunda]